VSALKSDLPESNDPLVAKPVSSSETGRNDVEMLLTIIELVISHCESAFLETRPEVTSRILLNAKMSYGDALRYAGKISFTSQDVNAFQFKTVRLEEIISRLEQRHAAGNSRHEAKSTRRNEVRRRARSYGR
jgi:hypothetical protein